MRRSVGILALPLLMISGLASGELPEVPDVVITWDHRGSTFVFESGDTIIQPYRVEVDSLVSIQKAVEILEGPEMAVEVAKWLKGNGFDPNSPFCTFKGGYDTVSKVLTVQVGDRVVSEGPEVRERLCSKCMRECGEACAQGCAGHPNPPACMRTCLSGCYVACLWCLLVPWPW